MQSSNHGINIDSNLGEIWNVDLIQTSTLSGNGVTLKALFTDIKILQQYPDVYIP